MATKSDIPWTNGTWNPVTGCTKHSDGCKYCYAEKFASSMAVRGKAKEKYKNRFQLTLHPDCLDEPLGKTTPSVYFVPSMSDLFHADVPEDFIQRVFETMVRTPWHHYLILTKRIERVLEISGDLPWQPNMWMGTTVESDKTRHRIETLRKIVAERHFLSLEPLLTSLPNLDLSGIDWVIVGGESGNKNLVRQMKHDWVLDIKAQCEVAGVPFFFKQWGNRIFNPDQNDPTIWGKVNPKKHGGYLLDGKREFNFPDELPLTVSW